MPTLGYMLQSEPKLTMSSSTKRSVGPKKISFDPKTTKPHVGVSNGSKRDNTGLSNGLGGTDKPGLKPPGKRITVTKVKGEKSSITELGSPWGVALKPVPRYKQSESEVKVEDKAKLSLPKLSFKGPHDVEQLNLNKNEPKKVKVVKNKTEVRLHNCLPTKCATLDRKITIILIVH